MARAHVALQARLAACLAGRQTPAGEVPGETLTIGAG